MSEINDKLLTEEFRKRANPKNIPNRILNKEALILFKRLCTNTNYDFKYALADEIVANRAAIMSLDSHINRLMSDRSVMFKKIEQLEKIIKNSDRRIIIPK